MPNNTYLGLFFTGLALSQNLRPPPQESVLRFQGGAAAYGDEIPLGSSFTMETWVRLEAPTPLAIILGKAYSPRGVDPFHHYRLGLDDTGRRIQFFQSTGQAGSSRQIAAATDNPLNSWTHIAATLDDGQMRLYVNAVEVARGASAGPPAGQSLPLGVGGGLNDNQTPSNTFRGALRQVRIWTRALSADELRQGAQRPLTGGETALLAAWPLDEGQGSPRDISPRGQSLQLKGAGIFWDNTALLDDGPYWSESVVPNTQSLLSGGGTTIQMGSGTKAIFMFSTFDEGSGQVRAFGVEPMGFSDVTANVLPPPVIGETPIREFAVADFDGDGNADVFLAAHGPDALPFPGGQSQILMQREGKLIVETGARLPQVSTLTHSVTAADIDGDGDIDLFVGNLCFSCPPRSTIPIDATPDARSPKFYLNDGTGHFTSSSSGLPDHVANSRANYASSRFLDANNDGAPDLVLGSIRSFEDNLLLLNDGQGHFAAAPTGSLPPKHGGAGWVTVAISQADFDGDGLTDLIFVMTQGYTGDVALQLALNNGDGTFWDASEQLNFQKAPKLGPSDQDWIAWVRPVDLNGDGQMDFLTVGGANTGPRLFINQGRGHFREMTERLPRSRVEGCEVLAGDFDGDGLVDLVYSFAFGDRVFAKGLKPIGVAPR